MNNEYYCYEVRFVWCVGVIWLFRVRFVCMRMCVCVVGVVWLLGSSSFARVCVCVCVYIWR